MDIGDLIKPGTEVKTKHQYGGINGVVKAVWVGESGVQYQIAYMANGSLQEPYLPRVMFDIAPATTPVGFQLKSQNP